MRPTGQRLGLLFVFTLFSAGIACADQPQSRTENAALSYWQAFAVMPDSDEASDEVLRKWDSVELDVSVEKLVDQAANALRLLHRGASIEQCDWGSALEEGPGTLLPHLSKARQLARLACLRARYRFESGQHQAAWQDVKDTLVLARHLGSEELLISVLLQMAMERMAISAIAPYLPDYPKEELSNLLTDLKSLPQPGSIRQAIEGERQWMLGWLRTELADAGDEEREELLKKLTGDDLKVNVHLVGHRGIQQHLNTLSAVGT